MHEEFISVVNLKNISEKELSPRNEVEALDAFVGIWTVKGQNGPLSPSDPARRMTGTEVYEWMEGGKFMTYRWHRAFGKDRHSGLGIFGYDDVRQGLFAQFFDNLGFARRYAVTVFDGRMHLEGPQERATIAVDHGVMNIFWQSVRKGQVTGILCELEGRREL